MSAIERLRIPRTYSRQTCSEAQGQTKDAFGFKWAKRDTYESEAVKETAKKWLFERYCGGDPQRLADWLSGGRKIILDAGCGSGFSALLFFGDHLKSHDYLGVDISNAVEVARMRFRELGYPGDFLQASLTDLPIADETLDIVFAEGVLHHTDDTGESIRKLSAKLKTSGRFMFYVYAKKAVVREFTDDYIRERLTPMANEEAWEALKPLTKLGQVLGELNVEIDVPEDIPLLGITRGKMDLQRFFYWNICKMYYRPEYSLEEMNHINFDWFRPLNCHRHTPEEVKGFCDRASLEIEHFNVQEAGITVVARKA
jgi:SAM-dependent methyltransferase